MISCCLVQGDNKHAPPTLHVELEPNGTYTQQGGLMTPSMFNQTETETSVPFSSRLSAMAKEWTPATAVASDTASAEGLVKEKVQCDALIWCQGDEEAGLPKGSRSRCSRMCLLKQGGTKHPLCSTHAKQMAKRGDISTDSPIRYDPVKQQHFYNGSVPGNASEEHTQNDWYKIYDEGTDRPTILILQGYSGEDVASGANFLSKYAALKTANPNARWMTLRGRYGIQLDSLKKVFHELNLELGRPTHEWCMEYTPPN